MTCLKYNERYTLPDLTGSESRSMQYRAKCMEQDSENAPQASPQINVADDSADNLEVQSPVFEPPSSLEETENPDWPQPQVCEVNDPLYDEEDSAKQMYAIEDGEDSEQCEFFARTKASCAVDKSTCPLHNGAPITLSSSNILIMQYKMRLVVFRESETLKWFLLIKCLNLVPLKLCNDEVTHANLNCRFIAFHPSQ